MRPYITNCITFLVVILSITVAVESCSKHGGKCKSKTDCCDPGKLLDGTKLYPRCRIRGTWFWEHNDYKFAHCERTTKDDRYDYVDIGLHACHREHVECEWSTSCCTGMSCKSNGKIYTCQYPPGRDFDTAISTNRHVSGDYFEKRDFEKWEKDERKVKDAA